MNPAPNLILVGPMGAGKSCIGRRLAERFTLEFVDADQAIVEAAGTSINTIFEHVGEAGFRQYERQVLGDLLRRTGRVEAALDAYRTGLGHRTAPGTTTLGPAPAQPSL